MEDEERLASRYQNLHAFETALKSGDDTAAGQLGKFTKYGSKIQKLVQHMKELQGQKILSGEQGNRIICFVQWESLKKNVSAAFDEFGVEHVVLQGSVWARRQVLTNFQYKNAGPRTLLLSLEESASGTNLTAANHVVFVHPMDAESKEEAVAFEMQAIGRVKRPGQMRKIHIWRFVTVGTVEQQITEEHQKELWERQQTKVAVTVNAQQAPEEAHCCRAADS